MTTIHLRPEDLPKLLADHAAKLPKVVGQGLVLAAHRGRTLLVRESPVDQGLFRNSWEVREAFFGAVIDNTAPHAGIIEKGARPHKVNREGIDALTKWVLRHLSKSRPKYGPIGPEVYGPTAPKPVKYGPTPPPVYGPKKARAATPRMTEAEARSIAFAIAKKLEKHGQLGLGIVEKALPELSRIAQIEVMRAINKALGSK